jgi:hypothetical protein
MKPIAAPITPKNKQHAAANAAIKPRTKQALKKTGFIYLSFRMD